ncbi:HelD family protein [Clostridium sp. JNZ X4-2]
MSTYVQDRDEECKYLEGTLSFIKKELDSENYSLNNRQKELIDSRREMWKNSVHFSDDFDRIPEMNQYLFEVNNQARSYEDTLKKIKKYEQMLDSPYLGRFDFKEDDFDEVEKIYIGLYNLIDDSTNSILVYDWRSPISSIFYQYEMGRCSYNSPSGIISGDILLKRQYKIKNGKLKYFFDSSIQINDEILQEVLSRNASSKMKNIVKTIQKEQDIIIRDNDNELLMVQGVAGSGKTSIALHRIAFLLYIGVSSKLNSNNVIIISPNSVFSKYISGVLPELGEENVTEITFHHIANKVLENRFTIGNRSHQLEGLINCQDEQDFNLNVDTIEFKGSKIFIEILNRLIHHFEYRLIPFQDVYYDGKMLKTKQEIKNEFLNNKINIPISTRLKRIENIILDKIHPLRKIRLKKIMEIVKNSDGHELEIKSFSRLLSIKETKAFMKHIHEFTEVDYMNLYKLLFEKSCLLLKLSHGMKLPPNIKEIIYRTKKNLNKNSINYEDCAPLLYIKLRLEGNKDFQNIKQVVVDEAQDYYPLQYEVLKLLFGKSRYTILGDFNQSLERAKNKNIYDDIEEILHKKKSTKLFLNKSYRSSSEIIYFAKQILNNKENFIPFDRHTEKPKIIFKDNEKLLYHAISHDINYFCNEGYGSIALICRTQKEADCVQEKLKPLIKTRLLDINNDEIEKGLLVIPSYMAKGLEFDVVLVYNVSKDNYKNEFDRRLLYVACTRALHQLSIYYTGEKSSFIENIK